MSKVPDILRRIAAQSRRRVEDHRFWAGPLASERPGREESGFGAPRFVDTLRRATGPAIIAEIKLASPTLGSLAARVDPVELAGRYARSGAAALSVVVEPDFFDGSYELLAQCSGASRLPTLAKDFVVDRLQLEWAQQAGADAVLLIAALLTARELRELADRSRELGMSPLVECHAIPDLEKLAGRDWEMVGVNSRNLRSFEVSLDHSIGLSELLPPGALKIAESGIRTARDIARLAEAGFEAFLVGESLLLADDPETKLRELVAADGAAG